VPRVLVIDDEPGIVRFVTRALVAHGFLVDSAATGRTGLELARNGTYDLVVLDLRLPGMNGLEVLQALVEARPGIRVLVLSAVSEVEARVRCLEMGALDYLAKPFFIAELVARIRARVREAPSVPRERVLRAGGVRLDLTQRVADTGSGPVALSAREFVLLQTLMQRQGQVCVRGELLESVWGIQFDPGTNVVDVTVRRLRAKLGAHVIATVRNAGYMVRAA
jgi:two-component system, OmpR family, response regulator